MKSLALALAAASAPALAQDAGDDWDLQRFPESAVTQAVLAYDGAPALTARCTAGTLSILISDLPPSDAGPDALLLEIGDMPLRQWERSGEAAQRPVSARAMRALMAGGDLALTAPTQDAPRRYRLQAPAASRAIGEVLSYCGAALAHPHDAVVAAQRRAAADAGRQTEALQAETPRWVRGPFPDYPDLAIRRGIGYGQVTLSCGFTQAGRLRDCWVETEFPAGVGFGREALRSTRDARLTPVTGPVPDDARISFTVSLRTDP